MSETIRCIGPLGGGTCSRAVHPVIGGAWCAEHRPIDLTGGVAPWEARGALTTKGARTALRGKQGTVATFLLGLGWVVAGAGESARRWRDPVTGRVLLQESAVRVARQRLLEVSP